MLLNKINKIFYKKKERLIKGHLDLFNGHRIRGWATSNSIKTPLSLTVIINNENIQEITANNFRQDIKDAGMSDGFSSFDCDLCITSIFKQYGTDATINVIENETGEELNRSPIILSKPDLQWNIDKFSDYEISGWIIDKNNQDIHIHLQVYVDDILVEEIPAELERQDLIQIGVTNTRHGFHIPIDKYSSDKKPFKFKVAAKYDKDYIIVNEKDIVPLHEKIKCLTDIQAFLKESKFTQSNTLSGRLATSIISGVIDYSRQHQNLPFSKTIDNYTSGIKNEIAVIIPVYKGIKETINCINSVLKSKNIEKQRLIVINDCSPEENMQKQLELLAANHSFELVYNEENLGFVGTVNKGMRFVSSHDVILLNSDTIVPDGWLDAIRKAANSSKNIATVTPMSNNATICSFPKFCSDNKLPEGYDVNRLANLCHDNSEPPVDLPTAHGFCMFIRRKALNEVGYFDEQKWGKGYAEENDFSLRATKHGWRNVMTNNTFVEHLGSVSFAENTNSLISKNLNKLNQLYPDYPKLVNAFIRNDPVRPLRNELSKKLLIEEIKTTLALPPAKGKSILFVSLNIGGGTKVATDDLSRLLKKEKQSTFLLTSNNNQIWELCSYSTNASVQFNVEDDHNELIKFLKELNIWHIHYHHVLEFGKEIWELPKYLNCEYDVTLHDYYSICPRVNLLTKNDEYCGDPNEADCRNCINQVGVHSSSYLDLSDLGGDIQHWRSYFYERLQAARKVITPSEDTKKRIERYLPLQNIEALPHPEPLEQVNMIASSKAQEDVINIGFIGAIGPHKGLKIIKDMAKTIADEKLNFKLTVIGYTSDDAFFDDFDCIEITGKYKQDDLKFIIKRACIDVFFLSSIWPETFSYTYSEVTRLGFPVVSFNHGAVVERSKYNQGSLIINELDINLIFRDISEFLRNIDIDAELLIGINYNSIVNDYYGFN